VFVVPVSLVSAIVDMNEATIAAAPVLATIPSQARLLSRRGQDMPLFSLSRLLDIPPTAEDRPKAIIVGRGGRTFAFEVGRMLGQQEVVVRPLHDPLVRTVGVSGCTDLGDGKPVLVLDLVALGGAAAEAA
jgi:two-component system chemotaxis sensor kinase CheA